LVDGVVEKHRREFDVAWALADQGASTAEVAVTLEPVVRDAAREALVRLYPEAAGIFERR
jgi:hypothetical protein